ncbi:SDR family oxidoreductase [Colwellia sp. 4_MG-2023]|jgi:NAD(P)-dependent dehydrogenase (short-subunit alcohol dehydrogenase family)|uniref:SDR family NAD(P)-dependent oxidoreductase n=1 Tax=unclassified Colwellia TaxID=196834 RepID=UPI001C087ECB|nr:MULTISPECIES: SDR family oxidoreductase [unclassified Colwellia]MBU2925475.1 SDR family oxidoreductase [Colwellia sp. C2M11]MDO6486555.1 SDR family oxidoreductase [Colwellia sp. 6_MG-2023]MDO6506433.1 SDR family oxidoreductase [Colwellia sp. 5_MG-2023]MDO6555257.1 SDR family oxidoreductase [Colwellia sp. 4_MG-2023]MDO6651557.1 SDR family oxidoreductase [Colwellia sp. 3_MG-2023]
MKKVCIITGGSSGIGLSIVKLFLKHDYLVFNLDLTPSTLGEFCLCDVTNIEQITSIISQISQLHTIDVLVSNAGIHFSANIENTSEADFDKVIGINVKGAFAAIKAVLPNMKSNNNGAIILMSSDQALIAKHNSFAYNLSKSALASMAKTTALDYAQFNIRANAVCPGTIETPLYHQAIDNYCQKSGADKADVHREEASLQPLNRLGQPDEVAELVFFLASDKAKFITGSLQVIDGGYTAQ